MKLNTYIPSPERDIPTLTHSEGVANDEFVQDVFHSIRGSDVICNSLSSKNIILPSCRPLFAFIEINEFDNKNLETIPFVESTCARLCTAFDQSIWGSECIVGTLQGWNVHNYQCSTLDTLTHSKTLPTEKFRQLMIELPKVIEKSKSSALVFVISTHGDGDGNLFTSDGVIHYFHDIIKYFTRENWGYPASLSQDKSMMELDFWSLFVFATCQTHSQIVADAVKAAYAENVKKKENINNSNTNNNNNNNNMDNFDGESNDSKHHPKLNVTSNCENIYYLYLTGDGDKHATTKNAGSPAAESIGQGIRSGFTTIEEYYIDIDKLASYMGKVHDCLYDYKILKTPQTVQLKSNVLKECYLLLKRDFHQDYPNINFKNANPNQEGKIGNAMKLLTCGDDLLPNDVNAGIIRALVADSYNSKHVDKTAKELIEKNLISPKKKEYLWATLFAAKQLNENYFKAIFMLLEIWAKEEQKEELTQNNNKKRLNRLESGLKLAEHFFNYFGLDCKISVKDFAFLLKIYSSVYVISIIVCVSSTSN